MLLLNSAVVKKEKNVFNLWLKLCPHPQSAAADLHNIATHHQVCSAARLWSTTELWWGPPGGPVLQRADEASQVFQTWLSAQDPASCRVSFIRRASAVCGAVTAQEGRNVEFIWPKGAVSSWGRRKYVGVGTGAAGDRTIKQYNRELSGV